MTFVVAVIYVVAILAVLFALYVKYSHKYWSRRGLPYIKPRSVFGNVDNPFWPRRGLMLELKTCYDELKRRKERHGGIFFLTKPIYVPVDPELIKCILAKDFSHFPGNGVAINEKYNPLAAHLLNLEGDRWKVMRTKLSPTFTSGKMKMMFPTLLDCGGPMIDHIDNLCKDEKLLDIKEILACYTTDVIGSCAFGLECNSFKYPDAEFRTYGRKVIDVTLKALFLIYIIPPAVFRNLPFRFLSYDIEKFFMDAVKNILDYRTANGTKRNDFMQLFLEIQEKAKQDGTEGFTLNEIAAQVFIFFLAGFETSSTTMTFCLHELAFNQDIQDKLRSEVNEVFKENNGIPTYDGIMEMKYMDKVVNETLRKYPPIPTISRVSTMDYKIPDSDVTLKKGTRVFISALGVQRDEEFYPEPTKFDPERFSEENKATRPPFTFLAFGEGPRICIGLRFGLMQTKVGLAMLLRNYKITPGKNENYNIRFDPRSPILTKRGSLMLKAEKLAV